MAGGKGSRLQPLTKSLPKPMLPLLDRPTLEYIVELLKSHKVEDITMTLCYMSDSIRKHFEDGEEWGVHINYQDEKVPMGTAGGIKLMEKELDSTFLVMSGDGLTDFDLSAAIDAHRRSGGIATLLLHHVACPLGYGIVETMTDGRVIQFVEKPKTWVPGKSYFINTGIYILEPEIFRYIPEGRPFDFGRELFPLLLEKKEQIFGYLPGGYWSDVGTLQQYYESQLDMLRGHVRVNLPTEVAATVQSPSTVPTAESSVASSVAPSVAQSGTPPMPAKEVATVR